MENNTKTDFMRTNVTLAELLGVLSVVIIPILVWGVSVETRLVMHKQSIENQEKFGHKMENKMDKIQSTTTEILIELQTKEDNHLAVFVVEDLGFCIFFKVFDNTSEKSATTAVRCKGNNTK